MKFCTLVMEVIAHIKTQNNFGLEHIRKTNPPSTLYEKDAKRAKAKRTLRNTETDLKLPLFRTNNE